MKVLHAVLILGAVGGGVYLITRPRGAGSGGAGGGTPHGQGTPGSGAGDPLSQLIHTGPALINAVGGLFGGNQATGSDPTLNIDYTDPTGGGAIYGVGLGSDVGGGATPPDSVGTGV